MLLDRNMPEQAQQVLEEAISASEKYQLRDIYFEALNLKNKYFPLADQSGPSSNVKFRYIKDIRDNLGKNEYIREYMVASVSENHECDTLLRERLITFIEQHYSGTDNEVIAHFMHVNQLFKDRKFESAYLYLKALVEVLFDQSVQPDITMQGLICLELAKACICLDRSKEALNFLQHAENHLSHLDYWKAVIYELKFVIALRAGEDGKQMSILTAAKKLCLHVNCEQHQRRWNLYAAWYYYMNKDFKEVIKHANDRGTQAQSSQQEQVILKVLELMSIRHQQDQDWFYYKSESLRKQLTGRTDVTERLFAQFTILKRYTLCDQDSAFEKLEEMENQYPWHPLSHELINLNHLMASQMATPAAKQLQYSEQ